jgi:cytochrome c553
MEHGSWRACSFAMADYRVAALALLVITGACGGPIAQPRAPSGELIAHGGGPGGPADACFTCHGFNGEGEGRTPHLAGLNAGYIAKQLADYANETRRDPVMTLVARRMSDADRRAVARYYAAIATPAPRMPSVRLALYHSGDGARGLRACANCHGHDGAGEGAANPAIAGQSAAYTAEQLRRWKRSARRNDARDVMGRAARALSEDEIEALALYIEQMQ